MHTHARTHTYTHTHTNAHTCTHTNTHIHTHTQRKHAPHTHTQTHRRTHTPRGTGQGDRRDGTYLKMLPCIPPTAHLSARVQHTHIQTLPPIPCKHLDDTHIQPLHTHSTTTHTFKHYPWQAVSFQLGLSETACHTGVRRHIRITAQAATHKHTYTHI